MTKIGSTNKTVANAPLKYCRIILTEDKPTYHRLVETSAGKLECKLGTGKRKNITSRSFRTLIRSIVQTAKTYQLENIAFQIEPSEMKKIEEKDEAWFFRTIGENLQLAQYEFDRYKTKKEPSKTLQEILVCGINTKSQKEALETGLHIGSATNYSRDIANTSADDMSPNLLAEATKNALKGTKAIVKILDRKTIKKHKMGLLEAVGKGAKDGPCLIIIEYWGAGKPTKANNTTQPIALIGKGVTYDSGGLNVKPSGAMHDMHLDMSGGAAVIGTMCAITKLGLKKNVVAFIPAAENAISSDSMRAGDIVTSMSGKTVEILHTDAEGRLILADAMTYAEKYYTPSVMIDVATLTGASLIALGQYTSAVLTRNKKLQQTLIKLGEDTGDLMWPLPLWNEYKPSLKSNRADLSNIATDFSRFGGCIEGGTFLSFFAPKKTPWAHIDIAPRMESIPSDKLAKGATGEPVRLLVKFIEQY